MSRSPIPWIGLLALVAMFVIPFLPDWIFEGPRTVRHWPRRHVCGACGSAWTRGHICEMGEPEPATPVRPERRAKPTPALAARMRARRQADSGSAVPARPERLVGELRRLDR
jgi:hypothetical protein